MRVQNAHSVFPDDFGQVNGAANMEWRLMVQTFCGDICREIRTQLFGAFRWANQYRTKNITIQFAKQGQNVFFRTASHG